MINQTMKIFRTNYKAVSITGAIQGTSRTKLFDELGLHSLIKRRWCNKLIFFYKIVNGLLPDYVYSYLDFPLRKIIPKIRISFCY